MKWSRERYYRGDNERDEAGRSRADGAPTGLLGRLKAILAVIAKPTPSPVNLNKGGRGYSTLGSHSDLKRPADLPFPGAPVNSNPAGRH